MIADKNQQYNVDSNIGGDKIAMGIHADAMAHIMGILTDLYSDPKLAILREYSTNALDSHIEAGVTRPIEVTTPSSLSPFFTVRDYGVGLSHDDIRAIYSQYGASTKRGTNSQVGMLGLGCKSALTYASQFTLVGIKDGVRVTVVIGRDEDGAGSMTVIDTASTDEDNGVTVQVPARIADAHEFQRKADHFFRFWKPGTVLVDGKQPGHVEGLKISDRFTVIPGGQSYVVMGNVPYPATIEHGLGWQHSLVARVEIGEVNFTPSREALHYTPKTKATIQAIQTDFKAAKKGRLQEIVDDAPSHAEALTTAIKWANPLGMNRNGLKYKGTDLPDDFTVPGMITTGRSGKLSGHTTLGRVNAEVFGRTLIVEDYDAAGFTAGQKKKLMLYADTMLGGGDRQPGIQTFALLPGKIAPDARRWFPADAVIDWPTIKAIKLPKAAPKATTQWRLAGSFDCIVGGKRQYEVPAADVAKTPANSLYYIWGNLNDGSRYAAFLEGLDPNHVLVCLPGNRLDKFKRENPTVKEVTSLVKIEYDKWLKTVPAKIKKAYTLQQQARYSEIDKLDPARLVDPVLVEAIKSLKVDTSMISKAEDKWRRYGFRPTNDCLTADEFTDPLDRYPLFDYPGTGYYDPKGAERDRKIDHNYLYLAAVYAADQAAKA
jgi:hypothetical protein